MICVCIGRGRHKHVLAEHIHLVEQGAKLVELRLDYITGEVNLKRLIKDRPGPVIISCRRQIDGGRWAGTEPQRLMLLRSAIAEGVEYVDLEEDVAGTVPRYGKTKRIVSLHDFAKTPDDLESIHARMAKCHPDIIKIAGMANNPNDNIRMLELISKSKIPTVALCMGDMGTPSRTLAGKFGAPFTYATFHHERTLAPGQLSFREMSGIYHYDSIRADTEVYGVIADPVGHSLSPVIHNAAFHHLGMNRIYVPFRVPRADLQPFLESCHKLDVRGLSVTIPHKESVVAFCHPIDEAVKGIGAANTIVFRESGLSAYNTDCLAAMESLEEAVQRSGRSRCLTGKNALILGAGGVAKALAYGLRQREVIVTVAARNPARGASLSQMGCKVVDWESRHTIITDILINATPIGMHPNVDESPYDRHRLRPSMLVFDTVYNPEQTLLIKEARQKHCSVVTGVDMFIRQAALQFQLFTGQNAPADLMRDVMKKAIGPVKS
jgi:3-dehydroquinate dehydratase/shikimate dehydrogenase